MPDGDESMMYGVGAEGNITGVGEAVTGAGGAATGVDGAVIGEAGAGTMTVGEDVGTVDCDCRVGSARVRDAVTASVAVATIILATVVTAAPAVATLLLLGTAVSVVVKMRFVQTAPTISSHAARR